MEPDYDDDLAQERRQADRLLRIPLHHRRIQRKQQARHRSEQRRHDRH